MRKLKTGRILLMSALILYILYPASFAAESMNEGVKLSSYQDEFTQPSECRIDLGETAETVFPDAYEAYLNVVTKCKEQYGETTVADLRFLGLSFLDLVDFDRNGTKELLLGFYVDFIGYVYNVWGYDGQRAVLLQDGVGFYAGDGGRQMVYIVNNTFGTYLLRGPADCDMHDYYYGYAGDEFGLVKYIGYEDGDEDNVQYLEDGATISQEEYSELIKQWEGDSEDDTEFYSLTPYNDVWANKTIEKIDETMQKLQNGEESAETAAETIFSPEGELSDSNDEPDGSYVEISTAEELLSINDTLSGHYILTSDIDLGGAEWTPLGGEIYSPSADSIPEEDNGWTYIFSGTFDGGNHTISNFTIHQPDNYRGAGLFGVIDSSTIKDLNVKDAMVYGKTYVSAIAGKASDSTIENVTVENVTLYAEPGEEERKGCFGTIVGSGINCNILDCKANASIYLTDECYCTGIIAGDVEDDSSIINCSGGGSINAGAYCMEMGGICGAGWDIKEISGCTVDNIVFNLGYESQIVGSVAGFIGIAVVGDAGVTPGEISHCSINDLTINTLDGSYNSVDMVGHTFLTDEVMEQYNGPACNIIA